MLKAHSRWHTHPLQQGHTSWSFLNISLAEDKNSNMWACGGHSRLNTTLFKYRMDLGWERFIWPSLPAHSLLWGYSGQELMQRPSHINCQSKNSSQSWPQANLIWAVSQLRFLSNDSWLSVDNWFYLGQMCYLIAVLNCIFLMNKVSSFFHVGHLYVLYICVFFILKPDYYLSSL